MSGGLVDGKAGLVTGAASGIGRACAVRFGREGAAVVVSDLERSRAGGEETVRTIEDAGGTAEFFPCDVARADDNEALVARVVERFGRLDFAHNNAGIGVHALLADTSDEDFDRVIAVNLRGHLPRHEARAPPDARAAAAARSSTRRRTPACAASTCSARYVASKHGIVGLTKTAAIEYAQRRHPRERGLPGGDHDAADVRAARRSVSRRSCSPQAMDRFGDPAEVAAAVVWLCSDDASFVTGTAMPVDAGSVAGW